MQGCRGAAGAVGTVVLLMPWQTTKTPVQSIITSFFANWHPTSPLAEDIH